MDVERYDGFPVVDGAEVLTDEQQMDALLTTTPFAVRAEGEVFLVLVQSSSCESDVIGIDIAEGVVEVEIRKPFSLWCTADLKASTYVLPVTTPVEKVLVNGTEADLIDAMGG